MSQMEDLRPSSNETPASPNRLSLSWKKEEVSMAVAGTNKRMRCY